MPDTTTGNAMFTKALNCLGRYTSLHPNEVFALISSIRNNQARSFATKHILRWHNDYNNENVIAAFHNSVTNDKTFVVDWLKDAMLTNMSFAIMEAGKLVLEYLESDDKVRDSLGHSIVDTLCMDTSRKHPKEYLIMFHRCFSEVTRKTSYTNYYGIEMCYAFDSLFCDNYVRKLLERYEELLVEFSSDNNLIKPIVKELLELNSYWSIPMAFSVMSEVPDAYHGIVMTMLNEDYSIERHMQGRIKYHFLKLLSSWYKTLNEKQAEWYQSRLIEYRSTSDFNYNQNRSCNELLCYHLWREKWELICNTLPDHGMVPGMKKCKQELMRRFGQTLEVERADYSVSCMIGSSGITTDEIYRQFSFNSWLSSFLKLEEHQYTRGMKSFITLTDHAEAFQKCVAARPIHFRNFVFQLADRADIKDLYKAAGLKGLLEGNINPDILWPIACKFITQTYAGGNSYSFGQIVEYYIKNDSKHIDTILKVITAVLEEPFVQCQVIYSTGEDNTNIEKIANSMLMEAINSKQGHMLKNLLKISKIPTRREKAQEILSKATPYLDNCLKLMLFQYLFITEYHHKEYSLSMMTELLESLGPEALLVRANTIQWCFYHKREVVDNYIDKIEADRRSHDLLAQIYYYGLTDSEYGCECKERLEKILELNDEKIIATVVKMSMKTYSEVGYREHAREYLEIYSSDNRNSVTNAYCLNCC